MAGPMHRVIETNGIRMHFVEQGRGPLVLLCHGFPESWYSWRHQLCALSEAGFRAVAADMRGFGQTDRPDAIGLSHRVMAGLVPAIHDWRC
jgi:epoxide hydrolase A/B